MLKSTIIAIFTIILMILISSSVFATTRAISPIFAVIVLGVNLLCVVGLVLGIIYIIKSKRSKAKRIMLGSIIVLIPFIIRWILEMVRLHGYSLGIDVYSGTCIL